MEDEQVPTENVELKTESPAMKTESAPSGSNFYKQKYIAAQQELEKFRVENERKNEELLKAKQNDKEMADYYKKKAEEAESKNKRVTESYLNGLKMSAIKEQAMKLGIRDEAIDDLGLVDHSPFIQVETTSTGNINILGAKDFVETLKEKKSYWFKTAQAPNINTNGGQEFKEKKLSMQEILKLEKTDPARYRQEILKLAKK